MPTNDVTFGDVITDVRGELSDNGIRIADAPAPFKLAWWPTGHSRNLVDWHLQQINSDYGQSTGPKKLNAEFATEVTAIRECLSKDDPDLAKWQRGENSEELRERILQTSLDRRAAALSLWEQIAFPLRRTGDNLFRVVAPRDVYGSPIIEAIHVDDFIRGVSSHTAKEKQEIAQLRKRLNRWKFVAAGAIIAAALLLFRAFWLSA